MPRKNSVPDRWDDYSKVGKVIHPSTIIPIKVPLKESLLLNKSQEERFSPSTLLDILNHQDLKLGAVVDLTYTTKYYNSQFFLEKGINYRKVYTQGQVIPSNKTFYEFASAIKEFEKEGEVICVHCTHGLNRSGYLICRYLIEILGIQPESAIQLFENARGHKMERQNYIGDLMKRAPSNGQTDEVTQGIPSGYCPRETGYGRNQYYRSRGRSNNNFSDRGYDSRQEHHQNWNWNGNMMRNWHGRIPNRDDERHIGHSGFSDGQRSRWDHPCGSKEGVGSDKQMYDSYHYYAHGDSYDSSHRWKGQTESKDSWKGQNCHPYNRGGHNGSNSHYNTGPSQYRRGAGSSNMSHFQHSNERQHIVFDD